MVIKDAGLLFPNIVYQKTTDGPFGFWLAEVILKYWQTKSPFAKIAKGLPDKFEFTDSYLLPPPINAATPMLRPKVFIAFSASENLKLL